MKNPWVRKGFFYKAKVSYTRDNKAWTVIYGLDLIAYWLIRWYHGEQKLIAMGTAIPKRACVYYGLDEHFSSCKGEVKMRKAMTAYNWNGNGIDPNADFYCCDIHHKEYVAHWTDMWSNVPRF